MDDFHFNIPEMDFDAIHRSYEDLANAHANLRKARRRARIVRRVERVAIVASIAGGVLLYKHHKNQD